MVAVDRSESSAAVDRGESPAADERIEATTAGPPDDHRAGSPQLTEERDQ